MKITKHLILGLIISALLFSCKKKDEDITPSDEKKTTNPTDTINNEKKEEGLEIKDWDVESATTQLIIKHGLLPGGDTTITIDLLKKLTNCEKDFYIQFSDDKDLNTKKGDDATCSKIKDTTNGTWNINDDKTKLYLSSNMFLLDESIKNLMNTDTAIYTVNELSSTKFDITETIDKQLTIDEYNSNKEFFDSLIDFSQFGNFLSWQMILSPPSGGPLPYTVTTNSVLTPHVTE